MEFDIDLSGRGMEVLSLILCLLLLGAAYIIHYRELRKTRHRLHRSDQLLETMAEVVEEYSQGSREFHESLSAKASVKEVPGAFLVCRSGASQDFTVAKVRFDPADPDGRDYAALLAGEIADKLNEAL